jgi:hypothetical protein
MKIQGKKKKKKEKTSNNLSCFFSRALRVLNRFLLGVLYKPCSAHKSFISYTEKEERKKEKKNTKASHLNGRIDHIRMIGPVRLDDITERGNKNKGTDERQNFHTA